MQKKRGRDAEDEEGHGASASGAAAALAPLLGLFGGLQHQLFPQHATPEAASGGGAARAASAGDSSSRKRSKQVPAPIPVACRRSFWHLGGKARAPEHARASLFLPSECGACAAARFASGPAVWRAQLRANIRRVKVARGSPGAASMGPSVDASLMDFAAGAAMAGESSRACAMQVPGRLLLIPCNQPCVRRCCPRLFGCE